MIVESTQILVAVRPSLMLLHVPLPFKDKYATFLHAAPLPNINVWRVSTCTPLLDQVLPCNKLDRYAEFRDNLGGW